MAGILHHLRRKYLRLTIAGYVWYDEKLSKIPIPSKVKVLLWIILVFYIVLVVLVAITNAMMVIRIRKQAEECEAPSRLGVLCTPFTYHTNIPRLIKSLTELFGMSDIRKQSSKQLTTENILIEVVFSAGLCALTIYVLGFGLLAVWTCTWTLIRFFIRFDCRGHEYSKQIQYHVHILNPQYLLLLTVHIIKQLFEINRDDTIDKERILSGVISSSFDFRVSGGSIEGQEYYKVSNDTYLCSGLKENEVVVYANEKGIIRIDNAGLEGIRALVASIKFHTGEERRIEIITFGIIPWTAALIQFLDDYLGPGPWPGVVGMEQSIIWLAVVTVVAQFVNQYFALACLTYPLSGTASPNKIISKWKDGMGITKEILGDECGCIVVRPH